MPRGRCGAAPGRRRHPSRAGDCRPAPRRQARVTRCWLRVINVPDPGDHACACRGSAPPHSRAPDTAPDPRARHDRECGASGFVGEVLHQFAELRLRAGRRCARTRRFRRERRRAEQSAAPAVLQPATADPEQRPAPAGQRQLDAQLIVTPRPRIDSPTTGAARYGQLSAASRPLSVLLTINRGLCRRGNSLPVSQHDRIEVPAVIGFAAMGGAAKAEETRRVRIGAEPEVLADADAGALEPRP